MRIDTKGAAMLETYFGSNLLYLLLDEMANFVREQKIRSEDISKVTVQYSRVKQKWTGVIVWKDNLN